MISTSANAHGPLFDGRADRAVDAFLDDAKKEVAEQGRNDVRMNLDRVLRRPTGRYRSGIVTELQANDWVVHDGGIIYGPWLEGVGSRNRTTRFKGYFTFRRTAQALRGKATGTAETVLRRYLPRMRG